MRKSRIEETQQKASSRKITIRYAECLSDVYRRMEEIVHETISERNGDGRNEQPLFWFRGHSKSHYKLQPNLYRKDNEESGCSGNYTATHLQEEYRFQHFMARNFDKLTYRMPQSFIEWQEIMQHYGVKTRLMDWSESLNIALEFALEDFFKPVRDLEVEERCRVSDPAIWILRPVELNKAVYDSFANNVALISRALKLYTPNDRLARKIQAELKNNQRSGLYYNLHNKEEQNMNVLISLSSLELLRNAYKGREQKALQTLEINPYFLLLLRYYSDGLPVKYNALPPLAIIHPYHSERIKIQKGVFTVFPHYFPDQHQAEMKQDYGIDPTAMECMVRCEPFLYKIQILNPEKVANELIMTGTKRGNLYPEMQTIAEDMENALQY